MILTYFVYGGALFVSTFLMYLSEYAKTILQKKILIGLSFFVIFIVAALRYNVGEDYPSYEWLFYQFQEGGAQYVEVGYRYLNIFVADLGIGFEGLVAILSFATYYIFYKAYPKEKAYIFHFVFICTLYLYSFSNLRSSIVYGLMFIATVKYIEHKKLLPFLCFMAVSLIFHKSSVVYLIIPVLFTRPFKVLVKSKIIPEVILLVLIALALKADWLRTFLFFNPVSEALGFSSYATAERWGGDASVGTGLGVLGGLFAPIIFVLFRRTLIAKNEKMIYVTILSLLYILVIDISLAAKIAARLKLLFSFINIIIIYYLVLYLSRDNKIIFLSPVFFYLVLIFFKTIHDSDVVKFGDMPGEASIKVAPYVTIFNKEDSARAPFYKE